MEKQNMNAASSMHYSVAVVATMSAGKSTLLNAIIGSRILPSKCESCTSKVYSIEDRDGAERFMVRRIENGKATPWEPADSKVLREYNASSAERIELCGDIKRIKNLSSGQAVLLYDTPGPNNSLNTSHAKITEQIIRDSNYCSLICVLEPPLGSDDEYQLLSFIKSETEKNDAAASILFVVNKTDRFDYEDDSIRKALEACRKDLKTDLGFEEVTILPVSSCLALLISLMYQSAVPMGRDEVAALPPGLKGKPYKRGMILKSTLSADNQKQLDFLMGKYLRHKRVYASVLKFSPKMKRIFLRLEAKYKKPRRSSKQILISDHLYSVDEIEYVRLLSGIPVIEKYLENNLKKRYRKTSTCASVEAGSPGQLGAFVGIAAGSAIGGMSGGMNRNNNAH